MIAWLDRLGARLGARLQQFGILRGLMALFAGLMIVGLIAGAVVLSGLVAAVWAWAR